MQAGVGGVRCGILAQRCLQCQYHVGETQSACVEKNWGAEQHVVRSEAESDLCVTLDLMRQPAQGYELLSPGK